MTTSRPEIVPAPLRLWARRSGRCRWSLACVGSKADCERTEARLLSKGVQDFYRTDTDTDPNLRRASS